MGEKFVEEKSNHYLLCIQSRSKNPCKSYFEIRSTNKTVATTNKSKRQLRLQLKNYEQETEIAE